MTQPLPAFENYIATLKASILISVLVHCVLLVTLGWIFPHVLRFAKYESVVIDLDYVALTIPPEKAVSQNSFPEHKMHESEGNNVLPADVAPIKKKEIAPLPVKKSKQEAPKMQKSKTAKTIYKAETTNRQPQNAAPMAERSKTVPAQVNESANPRPVYPELARKRGQEGIVRVRCQVNDIGIVTGISLAQSSGHKLLDDAALKAVRKWRFKPALYNGQPVAGSLIVPVEFRLR